MLQLSPTSPVQGDNFFGRSVELEDAWHRLEHSHLLVSAPRRVGKTSLLFRLRDQATSHGYEREHYIDVSPCTEPSELYAKLRPVWSSSLRRSARALGQSTQVSAKLDVPGFKTEVRLDPGQGPAQHQQLLDGLEALDGRTLLLIDELPVVLARMLRSGAAHETVSALLYALRTVRQQVVGVRWVFAGSVGLDDLARRHGLTDTINDLDLFRLGAFSEAEATAFVVELASSRGSRFAPGAVEHLVSTMGWPLPYFLQLTVAVLPPHSTIGADEIDTALDEAVEAAQGMVHWRDRLQSLLSDDEYAVFRRFLTLASVPNGVERGLLAVLVDEHTGSPTEAERIESTLHELALRDGYLVQVSGRYQFRSDFFRRWWRKRYGR